MTESLESIVLEFIVEECLYGDGELDPDEDLFEAGVLDSMTFLRMLEFLDQRFGVEVHMGDITTDRFNTVNRVVGYLKSQGATP